MRLGLTSADTLIKLENLNIVVPSWKEGIRTEALNILVPSWKEGICTEAFNNLQHFCQVHSAGLSSGQFRSLTNTFSLLSIKIFHSLDYAFQINTTYRSQFSFPLISKRCTLSSNDILVDEPTQRKT